MEKYFVVSQLCKKYGVHPETVRRWIKSGKLKAVKTGRFYRIEENARTEFEQKKFRNRKEK